MGDARRREGFPKTHGPCQFGFPDDHQSFAWRQNEFTFPAGLSGLSLRDQGDTTIRADLHGREILAFAARADLVGAVHLPILDETSEIRVFPTLDSSYRCPGVCMGTSPRAGAT